MLEVVSECNKKTGKMCIFRKGKRVKLGGTYRVSVNISVNCIFLSL